MESFGTTGLPSSIVIYRKHPLILREICHNTKSARCVPPVAESSPRPLGHPVKHGDIRSPSYSGPHHLMSREREECGWTSTGNHKAEHVASISAGVTKCLCVNECVRVVHRL